MAVRKYLIVIGGPTASGKTGLSIRLAQHFNAPILSADSRQFYQEMNIGTAKPTEEELASAQHFFVNNLSITEEYSVGDYESDAMACLEKIFAEKDVAILVGGSGLFIKAVCEGLDQFPDVPIEVRNELQAQYIKEGITSLQDELKASDPDYYKIVDLQNPHRLIRALGVCRVSGQAFSTFWQQEKPKRSFTPVYILTDVERPLLYQRIDQRVDQMIEAGLEEEARALYPNRELGALNTVGYAEFFDYFDGLISLEKAIELIKRNSRRYAKRQMTWLRRNPNWKPFSPKDPNPIIEYIEQIMNTPLN